MAEESLRLVANGGKSAEFVDPETGELVPASAGLPTDYNPAKGVESVHKLEALEHFYERAKDVTKLREATEAKLAEQRKLVIWHDQEIYGDGPVSKGHYNRPVIIKLPDHFPDPMTLHRWRKRLKDPKAFDATLEAAAERCRRVCEFDKGSTDQRGASGTGENEWYTPEHCLAAARSVMGGIDLDPASSDAAQKLVQATQHFTPKDDGLKQTWHGRVWLNPPYAQPWIAEFASKMVEEWHARHIDQAIMLTHNYTDTTWFHRLAEACSAICFTRGRIKFYNQKGVEAAPTQGQAFFYFGSDVDAFADVFSKLGFVVVPHSVVE